jgi:hypothetical protein
MNLRLIQILQRKQSISTDPNKIDYEESEDESIPSSPLTFSNIENHRLSSSTGIYSNSNIESNHHLRQSTPSLFHPINNIKTQCPTSSSVLSSSQPSSSLSTY